MSAARLALLPDFAEEQWPSMDLVAEQLLVEFKNNQAGRFEIRRVCPRFLHRATRILGERSSAPNVDRLFNRFVNYPRFARTISRDFDLFHLCDHSYSQVVHALPADRAGVFCHDLDTFRCLLEPAAEPRPKWFRAMAKRILSGMQKAAIVFHTTMDVRSQIERYGLIDPARLVQAPLGVSAEFFDVANAPAPPAEGDITLLHVGSCIPRKRIDLLLAVFAAVKKQVPEARLQQIGGVFTPAQRQQIADLGIEPSIRQCSGLNRAQLAIHYRNAALVMVTSDAEGFGLPVAEALASGAVVLASDIPVLREVGGDAALFAQVGDIQGWTAVAVELLRHNQHALDRAARLTWAQRYSWRTHAAIIAEAYARLLQNTTIAR